MKCVHPVSVSSWKESKNKIIFLGAGRDKLDGVENESKFQRPSEQMLFLNANSPTNHREVMCCRRMDWHETLSPFQSFFLYSCTNSGKSVRILNPLFKLNLVFRLVGVESSLVLREQLWWARQEFLFQNTQTLNDKRKNVYLWVRSSTLSSTFSASYL